MTKEEKKNIENLIKEINNNKNENKLWLPKLNKLFNLLC